MKKTRAQLQEEIYCLEDKIKQYKEAIDVLQTIYVEKPYTARDKIIFLVCQEHPELLTSEKIAVSLIDEKMMKTIKEDIRNGRKIQAIKTFREATGMGLRESKEAVEKITEKMNQFPAS